MKLKLGVIGVGFAWDRLHWPAIKELNDKYEITAVCDCEIEKAQGFVKQLNLTQDRIYSDYSEMLKRDDIDVVDILVPIADNFNVARDVILSGKDLIAEKPLAATLDGAHELIELKNSHHIKMMVAENFRYEEFSTIIKEVITSGQIGEITYFILNTGADFEKDISGNTFAAKEWRQHPDFYGGIFLDGGVHDVALMRYLFGEAECVSAYAAKQDKEYCPYRNINTIIRFSGGVIGSYHFWSSAAELGKSPVGFRIFGTLGEIYLASKECGLVQIDYKDGRSEQKAFTPGRGYYNELVNFYDGNIVSTPEKELGDIELIFKIMEKIA